MWFLFNSSFIKIIIRINME